MKKEEYIKQNEPFEFIGFKKLFKISEDVQVLIITLLFVITVYGYRVAIKATGKMDGYDPTVSMLFVPIYEKIIFRGIILKFFEERKNFWKAIVFSSILFSAWHFKNILWSDFSSVSSQMMYTGLIFGLITSWITLKTRSNWPAVIIHYLNSMPYEYLFLGLK